MKQVISVLFGNILCSKLIFNIRCKLLGRSQVVLLYCNLFPFHMSRNQFLVTKCVYWFHIVNYFPNSQYTIIEGHCLVFLSTHKITKSVWSSKSLWNGKFKKLIHIVTSLWSFYRENYRLALAPKPLEHWIWQKACYNWAPLGIKSSPHPTNCLQQSC